MPSRSSSSMMEPSLLQRHHELLGTRPAPLKVSTSTTGTEMVGVKKRRLHHQQLRQPVIIYVESPRVVHAHPGEFKSVVQRLTGAPPPPPMMVFPASASASASALPHPAALQSPFQFPLVGASGSALLPLTSSIVMSSVTTVVADASGSSSVGQQLENLSSHPFLLPLPSSSAAAASLAAACYHQHQHQHRGGDLFITNHHQ